MEAGGHARPSIDSADVRSDNFSRAYRDGYAVYKIKSGDYLRESPFDRLGFRADRIDT